MDDRAPSASAEDLPDLHGPAGDAEPLDLDLDLDIGALDLTIEEATGAPEGQWERAEDETERKILRAAGEDADNAAAINLAPRLALAAKRRRFKHLLNVKNAMDHIETLPEPGEAIHAIMPGNYDGWDIVPTIARMTGERIERLTIATLSFAIGNAQGLIEMADDGRLEPRGVLFVCSHWFRQADNAVYEWLRGELESRGGRIAAIRSHAKIINVSLEGGRTYTVETSANLRSCKNVEQFSLTADPDLHAFHDQWIRDMVRAVDAQEAHSTTR